MANNLDTDYKLLCEQVLKGEHRDDRTGVGTWSVFGARLVHNMSDGFPLLTTKRVWFKGVVAELLWFISGSTSILPLLAQDVGIWTDWPYKHYMAGPGAHNPITLKDFEKGLLDGTISEYWGELGPVYGRQWRRWKYADAQNHVGYTDQLAEAIKLIRDKPTSRRILVSAWNVAELPEMALPPCHAFYQFYVHNDGTLDLQMYQRSVDVFLGLPFNIASYALLLCIVAAVTGCKPGRVIYTLGDTHIYSNHVTQVKEQLLRKPRKLPTLELQKEGIDSIDCFTAEDISLADYNPHPAIKAPIAV